MGTIVQPNEKATEFYCSLIPASSVLIEADKALNMRNQQSSSWWVNGFLWHRYCNTYFSSTPLATKQLKSIILTSALNHKNLYKKYIHLLTHKLLKMPISTSFSIAFKSILLPFFKNSIYYFRKFEKWAGTDKKENIISWFWHS